MNISEEIKRMMSLLESEMGNVKPLINEELELTYENLDILDKASTKSSNHNTSKNETNNSGSCSSRSSNTESLDSNETVSDESSSEESNYEDDEEIFCAIDKFPVEMIVLECCQDTLDAYISSKKIKDDEWESIVLQILFTLIKYLRRKRRKRRRRRRRRKKKKKQK